jgi:hypothetical protein
MNRKFAVILIFVSIIGFPSFPIGIIAPSEDCDNSHAISAIPAVTKFKLSWKAEVDASYAFGPGKFGEYFYYFQRGYDRGIFQGYAEIEIIDPRQYEPHLITNFWANGYYEVGSYLEKDKWEEPDLYAFTDQYWSHDLTENGKKQIKRDLSYDFSYWELSDGSVRIGLIFDFWHNFESTLIWDILQASPQYDPDCNCYKMRSSYLQDIQTTWFQFPGDRSFGTLEFDEKRDRYDVSYIIALSHRNPFTDKMEPYGSVHWQFTVEKVEKSQEMIRPVDGYIISGFGMRQLEYEKKPRMHKGIDIVWKKPGAIKEAPVVAAADGLVVKSEWDTQGAKGWYVEIQHHNIKKRNGFVVYDVRTVYLHLNERPYVSTGQVIEQGDIIGRVGKTGSPRYGYHLHFGVKESGKPVNPLGYVYYTHVKLIRAKIRCPIDIVLIDPDGLVVSKEKIEIPEVAVYLEEDFNADGIIDKSITISIRKNGIYKINVVPEPDALPTDTYGLIVSTDDITMVLAEDLPISDIPTQPYTILSTESGVEPIILATIDLDPDTLNLDSKGKWVTAYIELPEGYNIIDIDISSVELKDGDTLITSSEWGDIQDSTLMVKFSRSDVIEYLEAKEGEINEFDFIITGLIDGELFGGSDIIRVKNE